MIPEVMKEYDEDYEFFYDAAMRQIGSSLESEYPYSVVSRILNGEHPVKVFREYRRLSIEMLSRKSNVSVRYLEEIEDGRVSVPGRVLSEIARALRVDVQDIA